MIPGPISSDRAIAAGFRRAPISVSFGPGPLLPLSPNWWQARQPDWAATSLPGSNSGATFDLDVGRRAGVGAEEGQERHRDDGHDPGDRRDRALQRVALRVAVVERQQQQQHHRDRRDADRRDRDQLRRLDDAQQLEQEEEVPLGPRHVGGRRRVGLRALLGAEVDRHEDDHDDDDQRHRRVLEDRVREEGLALLLHHLVLAEVLLLLAVVHGALPLPPAPFAIASTGSERAPSACDRRASTAARSCRA